MIALWASASLLKIPTKTTKYPGCKLENRDESRTPTFFSPSLIACLASTSAGARPFGAGRESRTIVQPARPAGQATTVFFGGGGGGSGFPVVVGVVTVVSVVVGSGAVFVVSWLEAAGDVPTTVWSLALERSASQMAEAAPAAAAIRSASSAGQIQSPGYQPIRRRHAEPRRTIRPPDAGSREPHSRQYSWLSA
jgi:hypothetical protein